MASKRKREAEEDLPFSPVSKQLKQDEVSRSGRVRKKPAKFAEELTDDIDIKPEVSKLPRSPPVTKTEHAHPLEARLVTMPQPVRMVITPTVVPDTDVHVKEEEEEEHDKTPGRSSRARKKSAKVLEMEEFEEAEKKQVKKELGKKAKSPVAQTILGIQDVQPGPTSVPIPILKIKDIPTTPKLESVAPLSVQISPQKSPVTGSSKSPITFSAVSAKSPDSKASVIKLLLSSPAQNSKPAVTTSSITQSPPTPESTKPKKSKKLKTPGKQTSPGSVGSAKSMSNQPSTSGIKTESNKIKSEPDFEEVASVGLPMITKDIKVKKSSKKHVDADNGDESPFLPSPVPSPNVIHVGPMNIGLEIKQESESKKKKAKADMSDEMMQEDFGLDMSEIELGDPGSDSFMEMEDEDGLMIPEEEVVTTEKTKAGKDGKKKTGKSKKKSVPLQLGDIPNTDGELVMDFSRMKSDDKKKKKDKIPKEDPAEAAKKKRAPTAYMMWCSANRQRLVNDNPGIDFSTISKTLGEMWSTLSEKDKMVWKRKAKKAAGKGSTLITTGKTIVTPKIPGSQTVTTARQISVMSQKSTPALTQALLTNKQVKQQAADDLSTPVKGFGMEPLDVAAHLKIVGEALSIIGMKLQEHRGLIAVQGSLSVLLDSFMCTVTPLMCLTAVLPETNGLPAETHMKSLDNIAYIMPGL